MRKFRNNRTVTFINIFIFSFLFLNCMSSINPLGVCMSVRNFPIAFYWIKRACRENNVDLLIVKNYPHHIAHQKAREFFLKHEEYTHFIIVNEDTIVTSSHLKLLLEDLEEYDYPVIGGYCFPVSKNYPKTNLTKKNMRNIRVVFANQYDFYDLEDVITWDIKDPIDSFYFNGLTLTAIRRDIIEKIEFKPYKYVTDRTLGLWVRRGIMFDLQFSNTLHDLKIPLMVDKRLLIMHFGNTRGFINLRGKKPYVKLVKPNGEEILIEEGKEYK